MILLQLMNHIESYTKVRVYAAHNECAHIDSNGTCKAFDIERIEEADTVYEDEEQPLNPCNGCKEYMPFPVRAYLYKGKPNDMPISLINRTVRGISIGCMKDLPTKRELQEFSCIDIEVNPERESN